MKYKIIKCSDSHYFFQLKIFDVWVSENRFFESVEEIKKSIKKTKFEFEMIEEGDI